MNQSYLEIDLIWWKLTMALIENETIEWSECGILRPKGQVKNAHLEEKIWGRKSRLYSFLLFFTSIQMVVVHNNW